MTQVTSEFEVLPAPPKSNHVSTPPAVVIQMADHKAPGGGPRANSRIQQLALAEEGEYAHHEIKVRVRYHERYDVELGSGDFTRIRKALRDLVVEHNGWIDPDSDKDDPKVLPQPQGENSDVFWDSVVPEELMLMIQVIGTERKKGFALLMPTPTV